MPVGPPGFRASVVRLVAFQKEEFLDRHPPHTRPPAGKRPFLLLLSPDTLQLATASDATDGPPVASAMASVLTLKPERPPLGRPSKKPLALLHKLAAPGGERDNGGGAAGGGAGAPPDPSAADSRLLLEDGEPLEEGQLLSFSIALSQVVGVELVDERRIKVLFARQKPHRSTESNDDWKAVMKSMVLPFALPWEGWKHKDWGVNAYLNRHRRDPFVSSVCFEADSPQEAAALRQSIEEAIARLGAAVAWLSKDLPLNDRPVVTLVTAAAVAPGTAGASGSPGASARSSSTGLTALGAVLDDAEEQIVATFPRMRQPLDVPAPQPPAAPAALSGGASGAAAGSKAADSAAEAAGAAPPSELAVHVWLHSPLGPAVATISEEQLRRSAEAGGAPICVVALPHQEEGEQPLRSAQDKLEVVLQFAASRPVPRSPSRYPRQQSGGGGATAGGEAAQPPPGGSALPAMLAVLAVPLLCAWLQLILSAGAPAISVLQSVAFLVSSLAAIVGIVVLQLGRARALVLPPQQQAPAAAPLCWRLTLLHADLVAESRRRAGAPAVMRVVSSSGALASLPSAPLPPVEAGAVELPQPIRRLVAAHPGVLTDDIAARFVVGLGPDKAYTGMRSMVDWVEAQGVADLVHQPQPRFELIKQHYPQVFYCWSRRCDAILEVECTGRWREVYDRLRAAGVTDRELLHHLFFSMEYAFKVLDTRPLPQGKTVKIIDLEGLTMRDVGSSAFKWYLQVGGALLAVNYPQRLHKAFLLNAPAWSGAIYKVLAAVIPRRTREQLMLFTRKQKAEAAEALLQWVPAEQLPVQYGGKCATPLGESELEQQMAEYVRRLNEEQAAAAGDAAASSAASGTEGGAE